MAITVPVSRGEEVETRPGPCLSKLIGGEF